MTGNRQIRIVAAIVALLLVAAATLVRFGEDGADPVAPSAPLAIDPIRGDMGAAPPHRRSDYGQGYESRHGRLATDRTDSSNQPSEESTR